MSYLAVSDYESFSSRGRVFDGIVEALKDPKINMVGVYGIGSVGKTTLVKKVGKKVTDDGTFYKAIMAVVSLDPNVAEIRRQLAGCLNLTLSEQSPIVAKHQLVGRLDHGNEKNHLIILDDVWEKLDLKDIGIPKCCKVVLTTRNRNVCKKMGCDKDFKIEILSQKESWAFFMKKLKDYIDSSDEPLLLRKIAWEVCKECHGLPVSIIALGAALKGKDMLAWEDALDKLRTYRLNDIEGINPTVFASLKWSYDQLDSKDDKSCFLLCCLFPGDASIPIDELVRYFMAGSSIHWDPKQHSFAKALSLVRALVLTLKSRCLLLDENYSEDNVTLDENCSQDLVKLHNVMRDLAVSIAEREKSFLVKHSVRYWPEKATYEHCSVISLMLNDMREFPDQLDCPNLHTLRIDCTANGFQLQVPDRFFSGMESLRALDLKRVTMSPLLPSSLSKMAKLQMLCLEGCDLGDISILRDLKDHLEILSLRGSNMEVLPSEIRELTRLRLLDMQDCDKLGMVSKGVISNLCHLEELYMPFTIGLWEGITDGTGRDTSGLSIDELTSLTQLTTLHIFLPVALLPNELTFNNLVRFNIWIGKEANYSHHSDSTGVLKLENIHLPKALKGLLGTYSSSHLTMLSVTNCTLRYLLSPSTAEGLVALRSLEIEGCVEMEGVIGNEGEDDEDIMIVFHKLNELRLEDLPSLISFDLRKAKTAARSESYSALAQMVLFTDKVAFPAIEELDISALPNITNIWDKKLCRVASERFRKEKPAICRLLLLFNKAFCQLRTLKVISCSKLVNVVPSTMLLELKNLEELYLYSCPMLGAIVHLEKREEATNNTKVPFPGLRRIELGRLQNLKGFYTFRSEEHALFHAQFAFPKLEYLILGTLKEIPLGQLLGPCELSLEYLVFTKCHRVSIDVSHCLFQRLGTVGILKVESCTGMTEVFHFDGLKNGEGQECTKPLAQIRMIQLNALPQLTCLWNKDPFSFLCLQNLEYLTIKNCHMLQNLLTVSVAKALGGLKALYLKSCSMMEEVIATKEAHTDMVKDHEIVFPKLEWLILKDLSNLRSFCSMKYDFNLPSLQRVVLKRCPNMQTFTLGSVFMPPTFLITRGNDGLVIKDLNKHLEQQDLKREEMIEAYSQEMDGNEDEFEYLEFPKDL